MSNGKPEKILEMVDKLVETEEEKDSWKFGKSSNRKKLYFNFNDPEKVKRKIDNAIGASEYLDLLKLSGEEDEEELEEKEKRRLELMEDFLDEAADEEEEDVEEDEEDEELKERLTVLEDDVEHLSNLLEERIEAENHNLITQDAEEERKHEEEEEAYEDADLKDDQGD